MICGPSTPPGLQRIHAVLFHQGAPALGEGALRSEQGLAGLRAAAADCLSPAGHYLHPPVTARVRCGACAVMGALVWGVAESGPCP